VLEAVDVWVLKADPQRFEVTRVAVATNASGQPEMLALRAIEALRAGLLQIDWAERRRRHEPDATPPMATVPTGEVHAPTSHGNRIGLEVGAVAMMSLDGLGPAVLPTVRVGWAARPWLVMQASAAGLAGRRLRPRRATRKLPSSTPSWAGSFACARTIGCGPLSASQPGLCTRRSKGRPAGARGATPRIDGRL
jgi:hypothetical protein